jgi:hypothetical protein
MAQQSLSDQWESMGDMGEVEGDAPSNWTDAWVLQVQFAPHRVRCSRQEDRALQHCVQSQEGRPKE